MCGTLYNTTSLNKKTNMKQYKANCREDYFIYGFQDAILLCTIGENLLDNIFTGFQTQRFMRHGVSFRYKLHLHGLNNLLFPHTYFLPALTSMILHSKATSRVALILVEVELRYTINFSPSIYADFSALQHGYTF
jgi:hypothetical protein